MNLPDLLRQFLRFSAVGVIAFGIDYGCLMLLNQGLGMQVVMASTISFALSVVFNYLGSMRFVFSSRDDLSRRREAFYFVVLSVMGLAINGMVMAVGSHLFGSEAFAVTGVKLASALVVAVWNFWSRHHWLHAA